MNPVAYSIFAGKIVTGKILSPAAVVMGDEEHTLVPYVFKTAIKNKLFRPP